MKIARMDWQVVYSISGAATILCKIEGSDGLVITAIGGIADNNKKARIQDVHKKYCELSHAVAALRRDLKSVFTEYDDPLNFDQFLMELDSNRYSVEGIMASSLAYYRWYARMHDLELYELCAGLVEHDFLSKPTPLLHILSVADSHAETNFFVVPLDTHSYEESLLIHNCLKQEFYALLSSKSHAYYTTTTTWRGTEHGALKLLTQSIDRVQKKYKYAIALGVDWNADKRFVKNEEIYMFNEQKLAPEEISDIYDVFLQKFPIVAWHNPFSMEDEKSWNTWHTKTRFLCDEGTMQIGACISFQQTTTHLVDAAVINNTLSTMTEVIAHIQEYKDLGKRLVVTCDQTSADDPWIIDVAVAIAADQIFLKQSNMTHNNVLHNRLLSIERDL